MSIFFTLTLYSFQSLPGPQHAPENFLWTSFFLTNLRVEKMTHRSMDKKKLAFSFLPLEEIHRVAKISLSMSIDFPRSR